MNYIEIQDDINKIGRESEHVIPLLQAIQKRYNYLPAKALEYLTNNTNIKSAQITSVATFYGQFKLEPVGEHVIKVCIGTACHVKGAGLVYDAFKRHLKIPENKITDAQNKYTVDKVSCLGCCTLAPVVQIGNTTYGHVQTNQIESIITDFETRKDEKTHSVRNAQGEPILGEVRIGLGSCCMASGSEAIESELENYINRNNLAIDIKSVGCIGMCHQVPIVEIVKDNKPVKLYAKVNPTEVKNIIDAHFKPKNPFKRARLFIANQVESIQTDAHWDGPERYALDVRDKAVTSFLGKQKPIATEHRGECNPLDFEEYCQSGGFKGFSKAMNMNPEKIVSEIEISGLRGRGGAGFPTFKKWNAVKEQVSNPKYLICNGDEGDPGAFMDRMLLESYPFRVIEGMLIAGLAVGANQGYFYIRAEYPLALERIKSALEILRQRNFLGTSIQNSTFNFDIKVVEGAGAFVCGEETALISSIEGKRGFPTVRPPFPAEKGLWGQPTLVNNTETFAMVPYIFRHGGAKFATIGTQNSKGSKVFALAGKINKGGLIEVPLGITIREVVEEIGGGIANGRAFKAVQIGGPSGGCIPASMADTPIDFESLKQINAMMGSGGLVVLDDTDCMVDMARYFLTFTQHESCGKCTFCRVGTKRMLDILTKITEGKGSESDLTELETLCHWVTQGSLCGLGKTAPNPVITTLKYFRHEYLAHINGQCPTGKCTHLINYSITENCIGCTICAQRCPFDAIEFTPYKTHVIKQDICIKCDTCFKVCPVNAITKQ